MVSTTRVVRTTALMAVLALTGSIGIGSTAPTASAASVPRPAHIVVVLMENHSYGQIIGSASAPYLNSLARAGASFTNAHGVTHPSQPNYLALFSGSTQGVTSDSCPHTFSAGNLATEPIGATLPTVSFVVPNLQHDMHDGTIAQGDAWLKAHLSSYVSWAKPTTACWS